MESGKVSENILKRSVLGQLKTKREEVLCGAAVGGDCAIFTIPQDENLVLCVQEAAVAMQSETENPLSYAFVTMEHLIYKCANNLAAGGAGPVAVQIGLIMPESMTEADLRTLMGQAESACSQLSMQIAGGQTLVSKAVNSPLAVVTGYGRVASKGYKAAGAVKPGQDIVVSKWIGLEGTAVLSQKFREGLLTRYPARLVDEAADFGRYLSVLPEAAIAVKSGVCGMHDASKGGIFGALWEMAEGAGVGLKIDIRKLPLRQETIEVCEYCNVNPYELLAGGSLVMITKDGEALAAALEAEGIPGTVVGRTTEGKDRILMNEGEVRYMDRPRGDELYRRLKEG
ncbi:MAG: AIR synthase-related protein [Roseburia sp.]|nr:AIR synthase-related protein [Roseburia sp.]